MTEATPSRGEGSGATAQGHGTAAGERGIAVAGTVSGSVLVTGHVRGDVSVGYSVEQVQALLAQIAGSFQSKPFDGRCPYVGLAAFDDADAEHFFGREKLVRELVQRVTKTRSVFITGPSGSGKSSLARAGLLHALKIGAIPGSERWPCAALKPGRDPIEALALAVARAGKAPELGDYLRRNASVPEAFHNVVETLLSDRADDRAVFLIDQFEEIYTQVAHETEREAFLAMLTHAASLETGRAIVLFAMRSDFISDCAAYPRLNALLNRQFLQVGAMRSDELVSAIAQPALRAGLKIDPDLISQIIHDMEGEPGALPLMQFALQDLFEARKAQGGLIALTLADYLERGGIRRSLERHADAEFGKLGEDERRLARSVFMGLIHVGRGTQDTRRTALLSELLPAGVQAAELDAVVYKLANARLITTGEQTSEDVVTISHERLIEAWPWLRTLVDESRDAIGLQTRILESAREWDKNLRDPSYLYVGARLAQAREQLAGKAIALSQLGREFVDAGVHCEDEERRAEESRRAKELEDARRLAEAEHERADEAARSGQKLRRRAVHLWIALGTAALLGVAAAVFAVQSFRDARMARARELAAEAMSTLGANSELGLHLSLASIGETETRQGERAARRAILWPPVSHTLLGHTAAVTGVAFAPDDKRLVSASADGTARIWDAGTGRELRALRGHAGSVTSCAFSPLGDVVATAGEDKSVRIWDAATGLLLKTLAGHEAVVSGVTFSNDGARLLSASEDKTVRIWEVASGTVLASLRHQAGVFSAIFSPSGRFIATGSGNEIAFWDAKTGSRADQTLSTFPEVPAALAFSQDERFVLSTHLYGALSQDWHSGTVTREYSSAASSLEHHTWYTTSVAFSPGGGKQVATASHDHTVRLWDTESGRPIVTLRAHAKAVNQLAFDRGGDRLATASADTTIKIWDLGTWRKRALIGHSGPIDSAAYNADGLRIATAARDGTVRVWDARSGKQLASLPYPYPGANRVHFSPDGSRLVTTSDDGTARLWDISASLAPEPLYSSLGILHDAEFNREGTLIVAVGRHENEAVILDAATGRPVGSPLRGHTGWIATGAFSPDGRFVVTASTDSTARIWDVGTHALAKTLTGHTSLVTSAVFSADGKRVATSSVDATARLWDVGTGKALRTFEGHGAEVTCVAFSPDGRMIATSSRDDTARLWDAATGELIGQFLADAGNVSVVAFSPNGRNLLTASYDGIARIHPVSFADVLGVAKSFQSGRAWTAAERRAYFHDETSKAGEAP